ncbi:MAG: putative ATPase [Thermodesulfobacteria bacterium]|nr:ATP-binding protein [Thermodesulfobacteriota bacterium]MCU4138885.1 putative ATPase [Thermodesulfobacteriota bacterium]
MQEKEVLKTIIREFHTGRFPKLIKRDLVLPFNSGKIISVIGPRRAGKTYLLYQHILFLLQKGIKKEEILYLNFEDERLDLTSKTLDFILQAYRELYPELDLSRCYFFFDEAQNAEGWERFVRRVYDSVSKNIFLTGSNSKLLSQEIATSLRGRTVKYELFPLTFHEFLRFKNFDFDIEKDFYSPPRKAKLINLFNEYLIFGGFPEIIFLEKELKIKTLQEYFEVMLYRDIAERYQVKDTLILKYFLKRLAENVGKFLSVHKIYNELKSQGIRVGKDTLYKYLEFAENAYFIKLLKKHYKSLVKSELAEKKVYLIDTGLLRSIRPFREEKIGILFENTIFKELFLFTSNIVCFKEKKECDFVINEEIAIQVCYDISDENTLKREIEGLKEACKYFGLKTAYIISYDQKAEFNIDYGIKVQIFPAYEFILKFLYRT